LPYRQCNDGQSEIFSATLVNWLPYLPFRFGEVQLWDGGSRSVWSVKSVVLLLSFKALLFLICTIVGKARAKEDV
jgi:hypothetical protein